MTAHSVSWVSLRLVSTALLGVSLALGSVEASPKINAGSRGSKTTATPPATNTAPAAARPLGKPAQAAPAAQAAKPAQAAAVSRPAQPAAAAPAPAPAAPPPVAAAPSPASALLPMAAGAAVGAVAGAAITRRSSDQTPLITGSATETPAPAAAAAAAAPAGKGFFGTIAAILFSKTMLLLLILGSLGGAAYIAFKRGMLPQLAGAGAPLALLRERFGTTPLRPAGGGSGLSSQAAAQPEAAAPISIDEADYQAFERLLHTIMDAYSRESIGEIRMLTRPALALQFEEEIDQNARRGCRNHIAEVKLLQGDLSEAWSEGATDYATVAMRFSLIDTLLDRDTGQPAPGQQALRMEATEVWTFSRDDGGNWKLSAIQQTGK